MICSARWDRGSHGRGQTFHQTELKWEGSLLGKGRERKRHSRKRAGMGGACLLKEPLHLSRVGTAPVRSPRDGMKFTFAWITTQVSIIKICDRIEQKYLYEANYFV